MTEFVFRSDSYLRTLDAQVSEVTTEGGVILDRSLFYAASGGQPGDTGTLALDGESVTIGAARMPTSAVRTDDSTHERAASLSGE